MGGTELLAPLRDIFTHAPHPDYPREVLVLTDGQVTNTKDVLGLVAGQRTNRTRVFSFGTPLVSGGYLPACMHWQITSVTAQLRHLSAIC